MEQRNDAKRTDYHLDIIKRSQKTVKNLPKINLQKRKKQKQWCWYTVATTAVVRLRPDECLASLGYSGRPVSK